MILVKRKKSGQAIDDKKQNCFIGEAKKLNMLLVWLSPCRYFCTGRAKIYLRHTYPLFNTFYLVNCK